MAQIVNARIRALSNPGRVYQPHLCQFINNFSEFFLTFLSSNELLAIYSCARNILIRNWSQVGSGGFLFDGEWLRFGVSAIFVNNLP
jgi:hypothetical protein